jgi:hypothetical protein
LKEEQRNCQTKKEEQDKIWSTVPKGGPIPRRTGRLTVGRKKNSTQLITSFATEFIAHAPSQHVSASISHHGAVNCANWLDLVVWYDRQSFPIFAFFPIFFLLFYLSFLPIILSIFLSFFFTLSYSLNPCINLLTCPLYLSIYLSIYPINYSIYIHRSI